MRIETIIIIALLAFLLFFRKKPSAGGGTVTTQLPTRQQEAQGDGGAARALIEEGADIVRDALNLAFARSAENVPPQTHSYTDESGYVHTEEH